jgi:signal transduction histidine kinase
MPGARPERKPAFLWRAALILFPVGVLAVAGLFSLRRDRLLADQEARDLGAAVARQLAGAVSGDARHPSEIARQFSGYREANFALHANRTAELGFSEWAGGPETAQKERQLVNTWQQENPDIDLAAMPSSDCILRPGTRPELWMPQAYHVSPSPPDWLAELSPDQKRRWDEAGRAEFALGDTLPAETAITNFLSTKPPDGARAYAGYRLLLLKTRDMPPAEAVSLWTHSELVNSPQLTEAGLPIGQLVSYQALRLLPDHAGLTGGLFRMIAWSIYSRPSILSPRLIAEAERVSAPDSSNAPPRVATLEAWWNSDERARAVLADFQEQHPAPLGSSEMAWIQSGGDSYLVYQESESRAQDPPSAGVSSNTTPSTRLLIFPCAIVEKALKAAAAGANISIPPYAAVALEFGNREFLLHQGELSWTARAPSSPLLGEADGSLAGLINDDGVHPFRVRLLLSDPAVLYARQRQRTLLFGTMIVVSTLAALVGLFAAWRSFHQQLQLGEMKSNFVSSVSHELRAPIASVRLLAESLERGKVTEPEKQAEYFRFIGQECRRLSALIENVLDFSRIEQGRKQYELEPTNLAALTRETVRLMQPYAAEKGVALEFSAPAGTEPQPAIEWNVDGRALQQALVNLMDNAIKHSPRGASVRVGIEADRMPKTGVTPQPASNSSNHGLPKACLWVEDQGPGIPLEDQEKIFERFYRRGSELRRETQGVGIGLSIVKHIVAAHGGRVEVRSAVGQGARFTIVLPIGANGLGGTD